LKRQETKRQLIRSLLRRLGQRQTEEWLDEAHFYLHFLRNRD
jgi:hypothetical protein